MGRIGRSSVITNGAEGVLTRCRRGDESAWASVVGQYQALVFSVPRNYGLSREDSADIAQATFTELIRALDSIRDEDAVGGWLATVARRNSWRRLAEIRRGSSVLDLSDEAAEIEDVDWTDWIDTWTDRNWVLEGILSLPEPCRDLLQELFLNPAEPSYAEVAGRLGRPIGSIGPSRGRCMEHLRQALERLDSRA